MLLGWIYDSLGVIKRFYFYLWKLIYFINSGLIKREYIIITTIISIVASSYRLRQMSTTSNALNYTIPNNKSVKKQMNNVT